MNDLNDRRTAQTLVETIEAVASRQVDVKAPRITYGTVFGDPDVSMRRVAVQLRGQDAPSAGFVYGSVVPRDGDFVRVVIAPSGDRFVWDVLGRDVGQLPLVDSLPTASSRYRGSVLFLRAAAGALDHVYVCRKKADDTYEWAQVD